MVQEKGGGQDEIEWTSKQKMHIWLRESEEELKSESLLRRSTRSGSK